MKLHAVIIGILFSAAIFGHHNQVCGQATSGAVMEAPSRETVIVESSRQVLKEIMEIPMKEIPAAMLSDAHGIVVIPGLLKGGFVVGVRRGHGVMVVRDEQAGWRAPAFVTVTGGSVGWQIGVQATDLILVFKTPKSVQKLMSGRFTIGADAAAAAGPVGRQAAAATDLSLNAEVYSYSRSRGLFAGISLDGSAIQIDSKANALFYRVGAGPVPPQELPRSAQELVADVVRYTSAASTAAKSEPTRR